MLFATVYLFLMYFLKIDSAPNGVSASLTLAVCVLFGGFMGMLDDWIDLKWRYKAFMPLIAALPLMYYAIANPFNPLLERCRTSIFLPLIGTNSVRAMVLLSHNSINCHDCYKHNKHA